MHSEIALILFLSALESSPKTQVQVHCFQNAWSKEVHLRYKKRARCTLRKSNRGSREAHFKGHACGALPANKGTPDLVRICPGTAKEISGKGKKCPNLPASILGHFAILFFVFKSVFTEILCIYRDPILCFYRDSILCFYRDSLYLQRFSVFTEIQFSVFTENLCIYRESL